MILWKCTQTCDAGSLVQMYSLFDQLFPTCSLKLPHLAIVSLIMCCVCVCAKLLQSCLTLCDSMDYKPARLLCPWNFPGKNTGLGFHTLLQGIFLTQGLNPRLLKLLPCRWILYTEPPGRPQ